MLPDISILDTSHYAGKNTIMRHDYKNLNDLRDINFQNYVRHAFQKTRFV